jgi:hypothetical protein
MKTKNGLETDKEMKALLYILRSGFEIKAPETLYFEDKLDKIIWEDQVQECILSLLEEELEERILDISEIHYEFSCPHCNYQSKLFYRICLHLAYDKNCSLRNQSSPCYPVNHCYIIKKGKKYQYIS